MKRAFLLLCLAAMALPVSAFCEGTESDTLRKEKKKEKPPVLTPYHRNVIKFNPTPMLLFEVANLTLSYERLINKTQSVAIQAGYLVFPRLFDDTIASLITLTGRSKQGINLSFDYRYYPFSRNRRPAPDGLYLGGYISYYGFRFKNDFDILNTTVDQNGSTLGTINVANLGFELGYQFIFWKRFSVDLLLFGPSLSYFHGSLNFEGTLDEDQIDDIKQETIDEIMKKYPALQTLFSDEGLTFTKDRTTFSIFFRYSLQLGFHF
jgi:hypothetical protein